MLRLTIFLRPFARYLLVVWLLTILIVSSIPSVPTLKIHIARSEIRLDYLIHFCEYGLLAGLAFLSFAGNEFKVSCRKFILITLGLISFAILEELHQKFIPGRSYNIKDIVSNILGILTARIFCVVIFRKIILTTKAPKGCHKVSRS